MTDYNIGKRLVGENSPDKRKRGGLKLTAYQMLKKLLIEQTTWNVAETASEKENLKLSQLNTKKGSREFVKAVQEKVAIRLKSKYD